jgi:arylsulfatase A-like enzyme
MSKPNILFVFADQLRYDSLACNGNQVVQTPTFDRIASEGLCFDQAFSSCPLCSPYRGQLMTGMYSHANGVVCNEYRLFDNQVTIAHLLKEKGYNTAYVGKWHLGYPPYTAESRYGFDDFYAYNSGHRYYHMSYWHNENGPFEMKRYAPQVETQLALDHIREHTQSKPDQPFCVFLSWGPPHWDGKGSYVQYPQEFDIYDPDKVDVKNNVPKQFMAFARQELAGYYGMITSLDDCMRKIMQALEEWGLSDDTIVCFSSDHGDHLSSHGYGKPGDGWMHHTLRASKATPFEESIHIPFLLRYPKEVMGNRRTNVMFSSVDVLPTLLGLCEIDVPSHIQGKDLSKEILDPNAEGPDSVYLQILGPGWPDRTKWVGLWRGVRTNRYTYARWKDLDGLRVLYDREKDPMEMHNVIEREEYATIAVEMERLLQTWICQTGDPFDTGKRLPQTQMLDLGQMFTTPYWFDKAPSEYVKAIRSKA